MSADKVGLTAWPVPCQLLHDPGSDWALTGRYLYCTIGFLYRGPQAGEFVAFSRTSTVGMANFKTGGAGRVSLWKGESRPKARAFSKMGAGMKFVERGINPIERVEVIGGLKGVSGRADGNG